MEDIKNRLIEELNELSKRINFLTEFIRSNKVLSLKKVQQNLLVLQLSAMVEYQEILQKRLENW